MPRGTRSCAAGCGRTARSSSHRRRASRYPRRATAWTTTSYRRSRPPSSRCISGPRAAASVATPPRRRSVRPAATGRRPSGSGGPTGPSTPWLARNAAGEHGEPQVAAGLSPAVTTALGEDRLQWEIVRGAPHRDPIAAAGDPPATGRVRPVRERAGVQREAHPPALAGSEPDPREPLELPRRLGDTRQRAQGDVQLRHREAGPGAHVADGHAHTRPVAPAALHDQMREAEAGVGEAESERECGLDVL